MLSTAFAWLALTSATMALDGAVGLTGLSSNIYDPFCAMACLRCLYSLTLDCSDGGMTVGMMTLSTSTECYAEDTAYLTSLAWCMNTKCADKDVPASKMEKFWEQEATGQRSAGVVTVPAKWTYGEALQQVTEAPTMQLTADDMMLHTTSLVPPDTYEAQYNVLFSVQREGSVENVYGIAILVSGFGLPIVLTWAGYLPFIAGLLHKVRPYLIWPSTIGTYHVRPLPYLLGNVPTRGQALYIAVFVLLNVVLTSVGYQSRQPNAWYATTWSEIMAYVLWRTGLLAYIFAPLIFLFSSRNNFLLWMTNWSHSTFLVLHRWVARVFTLQAILHSIIALVLYSRQGHLHMEQSKPYWIWGIVATLSAVILTFGSGLYIRRAFYEIFLLMHIVLSVILIVGCWYHYYDLYKFLGGILNWIYVISAVWFFDRIARIVRIVGTGPRRATVMGIGGSDGFVRIDIPGIYWDSAPGKHAYFYFPTLYRLRPWENHPFSLLPTALLRPSSYRGKAIDISREGSSLTSKDESGSDVEKSGAVIQGTAHVPSDRATMGISIYVRRGQGMTKDLRVTSDLLTLVEGPYPNNSTKQVMRCDRLLLIGGGIGITALLPFLVHHWNVKLCWSVKESARCLVDELGPVLHEVADKDVKVGERLNIRELLRAEHEAGWPRVGVVVSGPGSLCDDARALVADIAKGSSTVFELEVEAYSW